MAKSLKGKVAVITGAGSGFCKGHSRAVRDASTR